MRTTLAGTVLLVVVTLPNAARGQDTPAADAGDRARVAFLESHLLEGQGTASVWWTGWLAAYATLTVGQTVLGGLADTLTASPADARRWRVNMFVGAAGSLVGVAALLLTRLTAIDAGDQLAAMPADTPRDLRAKRARGERLLRQASGEEAFGRSLLVHLGNVVVNVALAAVLWLGYDLREDAAVQLGAGVLVGEAMILTQPTRAEDDWASYRRAFGTPGPAVRVAVVLAPGGGAAIIQF